MSVTLRKITTDFFKLVCKWSSYNENSTQTWNLFEISEKTVALFFKLLMYFDFESFNKPVVTSTKTAIRSWNEVWKSLELCVYCFNVISKLIQSLCLSNRKSRLLAWTVSFETWKNMEKIMKQSSDNKNVLSYHSFSHTSAAFVKKNHQKASEFCSIVKLAELSRVLPTLKLTSRGGIICISIFDHTLLNADLRFNSNTLNFLAKISRFEVIPDTNEKYVFLSFGGEAAPHRNQRSVEKNSATSCT